MRHSLAVSAALLTAACGAQQAQVPRGPDPCAIAQIQLKARLGPELAGIKARQPLPLPAPSPRGCAVIYTQISEEMPGEIADDEIMGGDSDQQLAIVLPDAQGRHVLTLLPAPDHAPGPVLMKLALKDLTGDGQPEVISQEDAGEDGHAHRGLRVFSYAAGATNARVIFDEKLVVKTPEGLELIPDWRPARTNNTPSIVLDGAGTVKVFSWNNSTQRFTFDEAATAARGPNAPQPPVAAPQPVPAPATPAPTKAAEPALVKRPIRKATQAIKKAAKPAVVPKPAVRVPKPAVPKPLVRRPVAPKPVAVPTPPPAPIAVPKPAPVAVPKPAPIAVPKPPPVPVPTPRAVPKKKNAAIPTVSTADALSAIDAAGDAKTAGQKKATSKGKKAKSKGKSLAEELNLDL